MRPTGWFSYDGRLSVSRDRDWTTWCRFFLEALRTQAESNHAIVMAILGLYAQLERDAVDWTHSQYAVQALDWMFGRPIFKSTDFVANAGIPAPTAKRLLARLSRTRPVHCADGSPRKALLGIAFRRLINVAEGNEVFQ